jgi:hypothetical protein
MLQPATSAETASPRDPTIRLRMMQECVNAVYARGALRYPLLNLVTAFIEGLAAQGGTRVAYIGYLEAHFPELCRTVGAERFYDHFRKETVYDFTLKPGYALGRDAGMMGRYVDTQLLTDTGERQVVLNIDRLVADFLAHVDRLLADLPQPGSS